MISSAYNYYMSNYAGKAASKSLNIRQRDSRQAYNKILQINRKTPFYKVDVSEDAQKYAIDLKENARQLSDIVNDLSGPDAEQLTIRQSALSSDPEIIDAQYIGNSSTPVSPFEVTVTQLAAPQINIGNYIPPNAQYLDTGEYSFDLTINDLTYEFEFGVGEADTMSDTQNKISRLINRSGIGLRAEVLTDSLGNTALAVQSNATGVTGTVPTIFSISDNADRTEQQSAVSVLGLNRVTQHPSNAIYTIDGKERISVSNTVTINNAFVLNFKQAQETPPVTIQLKADSDSIVDSINDLISSYNNLLSVATDESNEKFSGSQRIYKEFARLTKSYGSVLSSSGLNVQDDGSIDVDADSIKVAAEEGSLHQIFEGLQTFKNALLNTADNIALNPMDYVNNKIVAYKNPVRAFSEPYHLSAYTGMMFNGYT